MIFTDEVTNMDELITTIENIPNLEKIKVGVACFIFDKSNQLILNRRGPGARDEIGKLQAIGGSINVDDANFREALKREIAEEAGRDCVVEINSFIGAQLDSKVDKYSKEYINWIILGYRGTLVSGELENMEPENCICFEKDYMENFKKEELSNTAYNFIQKMLNDK